MKLDDNDLALTDDELPFEQILKFIRTGLIIDAIVTFRVNDSLLFYEVEGDMDIATLLKETSLK